MKEAPFQVALERALNAPERQTRVRRMNSGAMVARKGDRVQRFRGAAKGTGDLVGYVAPDGLHLEIEVKGQGGKLRPAQRARGAALALAGAVYVTVWPVGCCLAEAVDNALAAIDAAIADRRKRTT